jgi:hypothetical protein
MSDNFRTEQQLKLIEMLNELAHQIFEKVRRAEHLSSSLEERARLAVLNAELIEIMREGLPLLRHKVGRGELLFDGEGVPELSERLFKIFSISLRNHENRAAPTPLQGATGRDCSNIREP